VTLEAAAAAILSGEVIGLPTDTVYGIGVDPLNEQAVQRLYEMKGRPEGKPVGVLVADLETASWLGELEGEARDLALRFWPGALTLVVLPKVILSDWVGDSQRQTLGIRVPDHPLAIELLSRVGPLAVTSANLSGGPDSLTDGEARALFGDQVSVYLEGTCPGGSGSTVVDATGEELSVLRQGPIAI
jgi:L-threonylcarbamoyladenylate synthase